MRWKRSTLLRVTSDDENTLKSHLELKSVGLHDTRKIDDSLRDASEIAPLA